MFKRIFAIAALFVLALAVSAQPPGFPQPPGMPRGPGMPGGPANPGIPGGPPTMPGIPGGPSTPGLPGGPGMPNIPGRPGFPNDPPGFPRQPGIPGMPGDDFPGGRDFGPQESVWSCSNCKREIARGFAKPQHIGKCPHCGVIFDNTAAGHMEQVRDDLNSRTSFGGGGFTNPPATPAASGPSTAAKGIGILVILIIGVIGVLVFAGSIWFVVWLVQTLSAPSPRRVVRRRPRRADYDL